MIRLSATNDAAPTKTLRRSTPIGIAEKRLSLRAHGMAAVGSLIALALSNSILTRLYVASGHPVDYATGQTSFSGPQVKEWYAAMKAGGTLDTYWATQLFDFVFIAAVFAVGAIGATFIARINRSARGRLIALGSAAAFCVGATFDAVENLLSFVMLAQSATFADWLAIPYSTMAVIKFVCIAIGLVTLVASLLTAALTMVRARANRGSAPAGPR